MASAKSTFGTVDPKKSLIELKEQATGSAAKQAYAQLIIEGSKPSHVQINAYPSS